MEYNIENIIKLLVRNNYLTPLRGECFKRNPELIKVDELPISILKENLTISLSNSEKLSPRNIRDFTSLLKAIENVKGDFVLSIQITHHSTFRNIYIDTSLENTFDEI